MSTDNQYIVSARKYRPATFASVVGQKALTSTLKNAIDSGRLAQAYLFCGPRGVGKTSCARIFAKTINCLTPTPEGEACGECESCRAFQEGRSLNIIELDAASNNGVDHIRELNDQVRIPPQTGRYRVFIIDEVHMLSTQAFNAFLKTLEEPPKYVVFILATTEKHKVLPTILSRCQTYDFARITVADIAEHLQYVASREGIKAEPAALDVIARKADGAMRDALSIFDQIAASTRGDITYKGTIANLNVLDYEYYFRLVDAFLKEDVPQALLIYKEIRDAGFDSLSFVQGLGSHLRDLLVAASPATLPLLEVSADVAEKYKAQAAQIKPAWAYAAMSLVSDCDLQYRTTTSKQFLVEVMLIKLCQLINPKSATLHPGSRSPKLRQPACAAKAPEAAAPKPKPVQATAQYEAPALHAPAKPLHRVKRTVSISARPAAPEKNEGKEGDAGGSAASQGAAGEALQPVAPEMLLDLWRDYQDTISTRHNLQAAMRMCTPQPTEDPALFRITVQNPAQDTLLEQDRPALMEYIRSRMGRDVALKFATVQAAPDARATVLTPREFLAEACRERPALAAFIEQMEGEFLS